MALALAFAFPYGFLQVGARMGPWTVWAIAVVVVFAGASFFFSLAETSLFSLNKWHTRQMAEGTSKAGVKVQQLLGEPQDLLTTTVLGNTFASAAMLLIALWMTMTGLWPVAWTIPGLLLLILVGCEVLPKSMAVRPFQGICANLSTVAIRSAGRRR